MQFDLSRLTLEDVGRFYAGLRMNDLEAMADVMTKAANGASETMPDLLDLEMSEFNRISKAFSEADRAFAEGEPAASGVKVDLKKITARRMNTFYAKVRTNDLIGAGDVMRECVSPWPEGDLSYGAYMGLLRAFLDAVKKTATT